MAGSFFLCIPLTISSRYVGTHIWTGQGSDRSSSVWLANTLESDARIQSNEVLVAERPITWW